MKRKLLSLIFFLFLSGGLFAQSTYNTITIDGSNDFNTSYEEFTDVSHDGTSGQKAYFTWDADYLYFGIADAEADYDNMATFMYFDVNPSTINGSVDAYAWGENITTPFSCDYVVVWKNQSGGDYIEVMQWQDAKGWVNVASSSSSSLSDGDYVVDFAIGTDFREVRIKRSAIGSPSEIEFCSFTEQQWGSNWRYFAFPNEGWTDANRAAGQGLSHYHGFTLDDSYAPNSSNSYDYVMRRNYNIIGLDGGESFYVNDDGSNSLDVTSAWTFEAWIYVKSYTSGNYDCIMDRRTVFSFYLIDDDDDDYAVAFAARDGSDNIIAYMDCDGSGSTSGNMKFNTWYHVAATYDGTTARLFVNGTEMDSDTDADWVLTGSANALNIGGRYWGGYSRQMESAYIDEVRVSNIARSASDLHSSETDNAYMLDGTTVLLMHLDDEADPPSYLSGIGLSGSSGDDDITTIDYVDDSEETDFLPFASTTGSVPVELTSFTAIVNGDVVTLNWQTATEVNNYGFQVERQKVEGENEWENIGFIEGAGNSNSPKAYSFTDNVTESGTYSYRLKQIDIDGSYEYSNVVEVNVGTPSKFELSQNYPNPFNPTTTIKYSIPSVIARSEATKQSHDFASNVQLNVYNILGEEVAILVNKKQSPGNYSVQFNASNLPSGVYFYTLRVGNFVAMKKMVLLK